MTRVKSAKHLDYIRALPCLICGDSTSVEAAHIRFSDLRAAKRQTGMGIKPDDVWAVPLCGAHHREQHRRNERQFWRLYNIDPIFVALALHRVTGDPEAGAQIIGCARFAEAS